MKAMTSLQDLIDEAKIRSVWWGICIFAITYFLSHTSKSMWTNLPLAILILAALRYLSYEVEIQWRNRPAPKPTYLSRLEKKQLSPNDSRLFSRMPSSRWRRKIDSPLVESAIEEFVDKILKDFVVDLWYSSITPDKEAPELIRILILDALAEISGRVKDINVVDLLTRDMVDLIGNQLELYRKCQSEIGVEVMGTLSFEERDERLKQHLMASKKLHPALFSSESECKVLQRLVGGILAVSLKPREAQCPLVHCIARELLTCLVMQPVMNFASPGYINELIELLFLGYRDRSDPVADSSKSASSTGTAHAADSVQNKAIQRESKATVSNFSSEMVTAKNETSKVLFDNNEHGHLKGADKDHMHHALTKPAEWAMVLDATTKRRSQVLAPENLENMWTKGRNYQKKTVKLKEAGTVSELLKTSSDSIHSDVYTVGSGKVLVTSMSESIKGLDEKYLVNLMHGSINSEQKTSSHLMKEQHKSATYHGDEKDDENHMSLYNNKCQLKRSSSIHDIDAKSLAASSENTNLKEKYITNSSNKKENSTSELVLHSDGLLHVPKLKCRVVGAYFENLGSKSFAVYSVAVTDRDNKTWFVKRRYRNFERLHRQLKDIPNYSLHLPPKRFLSSSIDDYFVHQRCILLDKYLQDVLSIANIAEQHEVWDFLSASSKNYSFGKSTSVMKTLAVNVDDAVDDIVRQFKGVSGGLRRNSSASPSNYPTSPLIGERNLALSWNEEELHKQLPNFYNTETPHSLSDDESHFDDQSTSAKSGWHSDNELNSKRHSRSFKQNEGSPGLESPEDHLDRSHISSLDGSKASLASSSFEDPDGMPPEWTPPNVSVPMLNLVDNVFQLKRRGWLRRQVFWISKQVLQLMMEDAIDDWILRQINCLRRDDVIAQGIHWIQDILWPNGTFFTRTEVPSSKSEDSVTSDRPSQTSRSYGDKRPSAFELQLEAARRASDVKKMILGGAPAALVSLIGPNQYKRCAKDLYYFMQSTVFIKQLAYGILEMVLVSVFPELRDLILDIHESTSTRTL